MLNIARKYKKRSGGIRGCGKKTGRAFNGWTEKMIGWYPRDRCRSRRRPETVR